MCSNIAICLWYNKIRIEYIRGICYNNIKRNAVENG